MARAGGFDLWIDALTISCLDFSLSRCTLNWAQHHNDITSPGQNPRAIVGVKNHGIWIRDRICLADAELRQVAAISPLEATCRLWQCPPPQFGPSLTILPAMRFLLEADACPCTPQPHPFSRPATDNGVMTASRFQGLFLTARCAGWPMQMGPHRTVPRCRLSGGPAKRVKTRHAQHDTTWFLTSRPTSTTSLRWPWSSPTVL